MTTALAAQGGSSSAMALYGGTAFFDVLLSTAIEKLLIPLVYIFLALSLLAAATENEALAKMKKSLYQITTKGLRIALYLFTGYLTVTGVIGGSADQMQLKAAKLTISGMVPVVGIGNYFSQRRAGKKRGGDLWPAGHCSNCNGTEPDCCDSLWASESHCSGCKPFGWERGICTHR